ncbi:phytanoyl-CoA dioxygenase family protein [uncultured Friedmanniella sp.]|uniref:phytanoyl-CoA dioxygenase family protein n=1 Tax=uncultured Friedmanniella sp. TaxID=335381 RepID=UPI0035CB1350
MTTILTESTLTPGADGTDRYEADGVVLLRQVISPAEAAAIGAEFLRRVEGDPDPESVDVLPEDDVLRRYPRSVHPHRHPEREDGRIARRLMTDPRIIGVVESLIGPAYAAQSMFYFKPPTARGQALHQDNLFLQSHPETCLAAWIAIDDCDAENGGLMVIPGSHRVPILCAEVEADPDESFTDKTIGVPEDAGRVQTEMRSGDVLFFHGSLVHGSLPNSSAHRFRRSLIFHYVPQNSVEVSRFYQPLVAPDGREVWIDESPEGGPCGSSWTSEGP